VLLDDSKFSARNLQMCEVWPSRYRNCEHLDLEEVCLSLKMNALRSFEKAGRLYPATRRLSLQYQKHCSKLEWASLYPVILVLTTTIIMQIRYDSGRALRDSFVVRAYLNSTEQDLSILLWNTWVRSLCSKPATELRATISASIPPMFLLIT
jgi:hypothetical protein